MWLPNLRFRMTIPIVRSHNWNVVLYWCGSRYPKDICSPHQYWQQLHQFSLVAAQYKN